MGVREDQYVLFVGLLTRPKEAGAPLRDPEYGLILFTAGSVQTSGNELLHFSPVVFETIG